MKKCKTLDELLSNLPKNEVIVTNAVKAWNKINNDSYKRILCAISGGGDSDVMLDIVYKCDINNKVRYIWIDTGLEYQATKDHLDYLENKYGIKIIRHKIKKPIPYTCKEKGQPFISKYVSSMLSRLQNNNFNFENSSFDELYKKYPNCKGALSWWCNENGENSSFNIKRNKWLKEFLIENKPNFKISNYCCTNAKKTPVHKYIKENEIGLNIYGVRKAEGGVRAVRYKNCFDDNGSECDNYRPLFFYKDEDKKCYEDYAGIEHSKCYTEYGLKRTGCAGCPFGRDYVNELEIIEKYEPKLLKAVNNIFRDSYEFTKKYKEFCKKMDSEYGSYSKYLKMKHNVE